MSEINAAIAEFRKEQLADAPPALAELLRSPVLSGGDAWASRLALARRLATVVPIHISCVVVGASKPPTERSQWLASMLNSCIRYARWNCTNAGYRESDRRDRLVLRGHIEHWGAFYADSCLDVRLGTEQDDLRAEDLFIPFGCRPVFAPQWIRILS